MGLQPVTYGKANQAAKKKEMEAARKSNRSSKEERDTADNTTPLTQDDPDAGNTTPLTRVPSHDLSPADDADDWDEEEGKS